MPTDHDSQAMHSWPNAKGKIPWWLHIGLFERQHCKYLVDQPQPTCLRVGYRFRTTELLMITTRSCAARDPGARDVLFVTCLPGLTYIALSYHRPHTNVPGKSRWSITAADECHCFCHASDSNWDSGDGNKWFLSRSGEPIGTNNEVVAYFPEPSNPGDPWHGFPVSSAPRATVKRTVPRELVAAWCEDPATAKVVRKRLRRRLA